MSEGPSRNSTSRGSHPAGRVWVFPRESMANPVGAALLRLGCWGRPLCVVFLLCHRRAAAAPALAFRCQLPARASGIAIATQNRPGTSTVVQ
jgi:hypothetical protein